MRRFDLSHYHAMKIENELEYIMRIKHEVMLFTLETQSSKKLSLNGVLLRIKGSLAFLIEKHFIQKSTKLSLAFLKNRKLAT